MPWSTGADTVAEQALDRALGSTTLALASATPFDSLSDGARSRLLGRLEQLSAHVEAVKAALTAAIAGPTPPRSQLGELREDYSSHEIGVATNCSVYAADAKVGLARDLEERLQATAQAMRNGRITHQQARALSEATCHLDIEVARAIEDKLLVFSWRQDLPKFKQSLKRWLAKLDPDWTAKAEAERRDCVVEHSANTDGTGELFIRGPLEITTSISMALTAQAAKTRDMFGGTVAQRKLAGLRDIVDQFLGSQGAPRRHGRLPVVNVTIDLATLLGLRKGIAEIPGVGAIPSAVAHWLLADGAPLRRLVIDDMNGQLLDYGRTTYTVPPKLAEFLIAKSIHSASPHSQVDAATADMEHDVPYQRGGATDRINVTPMCRRWHRAKTHGRWSCRKEPDTGVITWASPTGLTATIDPYDYRAGP